MKRFIFILTMLLATVAATAQQKGLYLTAGLGLGANNFRYTLDNNNTGIPQLGFGGSVGVQYFFTRHWGLATGLGISFYNSKGHYANAWDNDPQHYSFDNMYDDDFRYVFGNDYTNYTLRLSLDNWTEVQQGYFLEIPLMLMYQTKWGASQSWGMYFGVGAKAQIPVISQTYEVKSGSELDVSAYYPTPDLVLPEPDGPDVSWHGYGTNDKITYNGDMDVKTSFALSGEIGFLKTLSPRVDLTLGAYLDYGLNNIKDGNKIEGDYLIGPENNAKTIHPSNYVGDKLQYNGYVNSHAVDNVNLFGIGGKIGVRIKIGKLEDIKQKVDEEPVIPQKSRIDTVYVINLTKSCDTCPKQPSTPSETVKPKPQDDDLRILSEPIFFDLDKDILTKASIIILNKKITILEKYPEIQLLITGNTCDLGSSSHNLDLGQRRANAARKYLENHGISKIRLNTVNQSFANPLKPNINEENREMNRRCDFYPIGF